MTVDGDGENYSCIMKEEVILFGKENLQGAIAVALLIVVAKLPKYANANQVLF